MDQLGEPEHVAVVVDEAVHVAERDVAHAVIDLQEVHSRRRGGGLLDLAEARGEHPVVVLPLDEAVPDLAIRKDRGPAQDAVLTTVELDGLDRRARSALRRLGK